MPIPLLYPMRQATAVGVGALSISLIAMLSSNLRLSRLSALVAVCVGILSLTGHIVRWTHIDNAEQDPLPAFISLLLSAFPNLLLFHRWFGDSRFGFGPIECPSIGLGCDFGRCHGHDWRMQSAKRAARRPSGESRLRR